MHSRFSQELAMIEAAKCLNCVEAKCVEGCPTKVEIAEIISLVKEKRFQEARELLAEKNPIPRVTCRVCRQEKQCEGSCILNAKQAPVRFSRIEGFLAENFSAKKTEPAANGKKIAVIGSGPAGLEAAKKLSEKGFLVKVFESKLGVGGLLKYGIPDFRLNKRIVEEELNALKNKNIEFLCGEKIGKKRFSEMLKEFDAILLATGAPEPHCLRIEGEEKENVLKAFNWLEQPTELSGKVIVVGGGDVSIDAARTAKRFGADVTLTFRRTEKELPCQHENKRNAEREGIKFLYQVSPVKALGKKQVQEVEFAEVKFGEINEKGKKKIELSDKTKKLKCDYLISAIGQSPSAKFLKEIGIELTGTEKTSKEKVFASGDLVLGASSVAEAIYSGGRAAEEIENYLEK